MTLASLAKVGFFLSYIYEEVLGWDISVNSIEDLRTFQLRDCIPKRGVEIKRLDKKLLKLNLNKIADALDSSADLDFDYLGIQTLYIDILWSIN